MHGDIDNASFADGNTPYTFAKKFDVIESIEQCSMSLFKWFELNLLKVHADKCQFLTSTDQEVSLNVDNFTIKNLECEKLLRVKFDSKLTFDQHISDLSTRVSRKVDTLARITRYMNLLKQHLLMNSFFKAQFNYFPLIWMNHSSENNRKINQHRERCFRIIYNNKKLPFNELLEKDSFVSIHVRNLQVLVTVKF